MRVRRSGTSGSRIRGRAATAAALLTLLLASPMTSCSDGRPAFCDDLARAADMSALTKALDARDLDKARVAARDFRDLADAAPGSIRAELRDLAGAVSDIVELIAEERNASLGAAGATNPGKGTEPGADQSRTELDARLGELSAVSSRVGRWAERNCGLRLS